MPRTSNTSMMTSSKAVSVASFAKVRLVLDRRTDRMSSLPKFEIRGTGDERGVK